MKLEEYNKIREKVNPILIKLFKLELVAISNNNRFIGVGIRKYLVPDVLLDFWSDEKDVFSKNMFDFIFNDKYTVSIDNDNH